MSAFRKDPMIDDTKTKPEYNQSILFAPICRGRSPFRRLGARGERWTIAGFVLFLGALLGFPLLIFYLPDRIQHSPWSAAILMGLIMSSVGPMARGSYLNREERAAFLAATLPAPEEKNLLIYISASIHGTDKEQDQAARIVCELLGRLSENELACIPNEDWYRLCPRVEETPSGYSNAKNRDRKDLVHTAVFSAIMRMKRMQSLPYIESWMEHRNVTRHSGAFVRTLHECYETLQNHRKNLPHSSTLLRPSSAESAATPNVLLRPVTGKHPSATESGEQLLRASTEQD